jgi:hypothetical protein
LAFLPSVTSSLQQLAFEGLELLVQVQS